MATDAQLNLFNQLMATGDYAGAAQVAQQANYDPADVASYINQNLAGLNLPTDANISADLVQSLYSQSYTQVRCLSGLRIRLYLLLVGWKQ
jgi:hypothetical protein